MVEGLEMDHYARLQLEFASSHHTPLRNELNLSRLIRDQDNVKLLIVAREILQPKFMSKSGVDGLVPSDGPLPLSPQ